MERPVKHNTACAVFDARPPAHSHARPTSILRYNSGPVPVPHSPSVPPSPSLSLQLRRPRPSQRHYRRRAFHQALLCIAFAQLPSSYRPVTARLGLAVLPLRLPPSSDLRPSRCIADYRSSRLPPVCLVPAIARRPDRPTGTRCLESILLIGLQPTGLSPTSARRLDNPLSPFPTPITTNLVHRSKSFALQPAPAPAYIHTHTHIYIYSRQNLTMSGGEVTPSPGIGGSNASEFVSDWKSSWLVSEPLVNPPFSRSANYIGMDALTCSDMPFTNCPQNA